MTPRALHFNIRCYSHPSCVYAQCSRAFLQMCWGFVVPATSFRWLCGCWGRAVTGCVPKPGDEAEQQLSWGLAENSFLPFLFFFSPRWKQEEALAGRRLMPCHKIVFSRISAVRAKPLAGHTPGCGQHLLSQLVIKPMFLLDHKSYEY